MVTGGWGNGGGVGFFAGILVLSFDQGMSGWRRMRSRSGQPFACGSLHKGKMPDRIAHPSIPSLPRPFRDFVGAGLRPELGSAGADGEISFAESMSGLEHLPAY